MLCLLISRFERMKAGNKVKKGDFFVIKNEKGNENKVFSEAKQVCRKSRNRNYICRTP